MMFVAPNSALAAEIYGEMAMTFNHPPVVEEVIMPSRASQRVAP